MPGLPLLLSVLLAASGIATPVAKPPGATPHPNSRSISRLVVDGPRIQLDLRCQVASVLEVVDADRNLDLWLSDEELTASRDEIAAYLLDHFVLRTDSGGAPDGGRRLEGSLLAMVIQEEVGGLIPEQWVVSTFTFEDEREVSDLLVEMTLFLLTSPDHRDVSQLVWHGEALPATVFFMGDFRRRFAPDAAAADEANAAEALAAAADGAQPDTAAADATGDHATRADATAAEAGASGSTDAMPASVTATAPTFRDGAEAAFANGLWIAWMLALIAGAKGWRSAWIAAALAAASMLVTARYGIGGGARLSADALSLWLPLALLLTGITSLRSGERAKWPEALAFGTMFGAALGHGFEAQGLVADASMPWPAWLGATASLAGVAALALGLASSARRRPREGEEPRPGLLPDGLRGVVSGLALAVALWRLSDLVLDQL